MLFNGADSNRKRHVVVALSCTFAAVSAGKVRRMALRHGGSKIRGDCPMPLGLLSVVVSGGHVLVEFGFVRLPTWRWRPDSPLSCH